MITIDEAKKKLESMSPEDRAKWLAAAKKVNDGLLWKPNPGPQTAAYYSLADELFFGGSAGPGKTQLGLGLAVNEHDNSLLLRRTNKEADGLVRHLAGIIGNRDGWNGQHGTWTLPGRTIEIGGCQLEEDKQKRKGFPHDLIFYDEVSDFSETQYIFIQAWNRSTKPGQRCRVVAAGNPPTSPEGFWVLKRWGAWLDPHHPNPAQPGELRWYTTGAEGAEIEVNGPGPHFIAGQTVTARSRTFIPAKLSDNPEQDTPEYRAVLAGLPPLERAAYRDGLFGAALEDEANQCIPTTWVQAAQARWAPNPPVGVPMCAIGVDVSLPGGKDATVIARRHDGWFAQLIVLQGKEVLDTKQLAGRIVAVRRDGAKVIIDLGGGWGGDALATLRENGIDAVGYMGIKKYGGRTENSALKLSNTRTAAYWRFREALDPTQPNGSSICLPPSSALLADLCAPRYKNATNGLALESKEDVCKRIGRSPDSGDAVVMAWFDGQKQKNISGGWAAAQGGPLPDRQITKRNRR